MKWIFFVIFCLTTLWLFDLPVIVENVRGSRVMDYTLSYGLGLFSINLFCLVMFFKSDKKE